MAVAAPPRTTRPGTGDRRPPAAPVADAGRAGPRPDHALLVRLGAWAALALFAGHAWAVQVGPASRGAAWGAVGAGLVVAAILLAVPVVGRGLVGRALVPAAALVAVLLAFAGSGIALRLLVPDAWGELADGIAQGLGALPGVRVPYRGFDEWTRAVIVLGGTLLVTTSAYVAFAPTRTGTGRPYAAAALLGVLYAVPVVERSPQRPFLSGAVFALLLATLLWADRLRRDQVRVATALVGAAVIAAAIVAPRVDGEAPLLDYEQLVADSLQPRNATRFEWSHAYGPLQWPRDGREVLRVKAPQGTYWKAAVLGDFDGDIWTTSRGYNPRELDTEFAPNPSFRATVGIVVRNLRSGEYVAAGTTEEIIDSPRIAIPGGSGTWLTGSQPLRRGDSYRARVYIPRPSQAALRTAGDDYPDFTRRYLTMRLPRDAISRTTPTAIDRRAQLVFPEWGEEGPIYALFQRGLPDLNGRERILDSPYARTFRLARSIRAASSTPYEFVRNVRARVMRDATYTETPALRDHPLDAFLFDVREGYCQHFSGAMALLLRMGGVPARVASGFTSGSFSERRKEWVVRDLDAHSWVEAYFPGQGWVAFDPTPEVAPPRAQLVDVGDDESAVESEGGGGDSGAGAGDRQNDAGIGNDPAAADEGSGGIPTAVLAGLPLGMLVLLALATRARGRRRDHGVRDDPELVELVRALRRTGRGPAPGTTLAALEHAVRHDQDAADYLRAVRATRYGPPGSAAVPPPRSRRALRAVLGEGLGVSGRLRAWWALPPQPRLRRGAGARRGRPYTR